MLKLKERWVQLKNTLRDIVQSSEESSERSQAKTMRGSLRERMPTVHLDQEAVLEMNIQRLD